MLYFFPSDKTQGLCLLSCVLSHKNLTVLKLAGALECYISSLWQRGGAPKARLGWLLSCAAVHRKKFYPENLGKRGKKKHFPYNSWAKMLSVEIQSSM